MDKTLRNAAQSRAWRHEKEEDFEHLRYYVEPVSYLGSNLVPMKMSLAELRVRLKSRGMDAYGTRVELAHTLEEQLENERLAAVQKRKDKATAGMRMMRTLVHQCVREAASVGSEFSLLLLGSSKRLLTRSVPHAYEKCILIRLVLDFLFLL